MSSPAVPAPASAVPAAASAVPAAAPAAPAVPAVADTAAAAAAPPPPSKSALKKAAAKEKKAAAKAARAAARGGAGAATEGRKDAAAAAADDGDTDSTGRVCFGVLPPIRSQGAPLAPEVRALFAQIADVAGVPPAEADAAEAAAAGDDAWTDVDGVSVRRGWVLVRARVHTTRLVGQALGFAVLRQGLHTLQAVVSARSKGGASLPRRLVAFAAGGTGGSAARESIVDVAGPVVTARVTGCSRADVELRVRRFFVRVAALPTLPVQIEDLSRPRAEARAAKAEAARLDTAMADVDRALHAEPAPAGAARAELAERRARLERERAAVSVVTVNRETRLNYRVLDLRTSANHAVFRVQSMVCLLFREFLLSHGFTEIHSPKILGGASEGGSQVFRIDYFGRPAFLAQSPQLYKQMAVAADFGRVFEVAPVFRAEESNTYRHLTEFVGLDLEMAFVQHYHEVLDVLDDLFDFIFGGVAQRCVPELAAIRHQFPFEPFLWTHPAPRLTFAEAVALLRAAGHAQDEFEDLSSENERHLGAIVRERYASDFFIVDKFPLAVRPFYTMPDPVDPRLSNSYDFFMRGAEILSGAQRIHEPGLLRERADALGITGIDGYISSFEYGAPPHAGGGIGLERVVFLFLALGNIRTSSLFPRDPKRTSP